MLNTPLLYVSSFLGLQIFSYFIKISIFIVNENNLKEILTVIVIFLSCYNKRFGKCVHMKSETDRFTYSLKDL
jgi:hypothetical protein